MKKPALRCLIRGLIVLGLVVMVFANRPKTAAPLGQVLPSPYYISDNHDFSYLARGPKFNLQREAAAMKAYKTDLEAQRLTEQIP